MDDFNSPAAVQSSMRDSSVFTPAINTVSDLTSRLLATYRFYLYFSSNYK